MNQKPRSLYSPKPPSGQRSRTNTNLSNHNHNKENIECEQEKGNLFSASFGVENEIENEKESNKNQKRNHLSNKKQRKSEPIRLFEEETRRNNKKKRRYSDISDIASSRIRLNASELKRSRSPNSKRRRTSDITDLFAMDQHSQYKVQGMAHIIDQDELTRLNLQQFMRKTSKHSFKIREIISAQDVIIAVSYKGLAAAFDRRDLSLLCYLNESIDEEIQSLFYNSSNFSFIVCSSIHFGEQLKTRSIRAQSLKYGKPRGTQLFETENCSSPGWLEYDDDKNRVLTYDDTKKMYGLWNLSDYSLIYKFGKMSLSTNINNGNEKNDEDVKITHNGLIQCGPKNEITNKRMIAIRDLDKNKITKTFEICVSDLEQKEDKEPYDFMEYHNGYLYVKYDDNTSLTVYDCRDSKKAPIIWKKYEIPNAYLFLKRINRLLYFTNTGDENERLNYGHYGVKDLISGDDVSLDQYAKNPDHGDSVMYVTRNQTKIVYYAKFKNEERKKKVDDDKKSRAEGIIQINSLETGKLFGWLMSDDEMMQNKVPLKHRWCLSKKKNEERENVLINKNPLKSVSAIYYDEVQNEIVTASKSGRIYLWA